MIESGSLPRLRLSGFKLSVTKEHGEIWHLSLCNAGRVGCSTKCGTVAVDASI